MTALMTTAVARAVTPTPNRDFDSIKCAWGWSRGQAWVLLRNTSRKTWHSMDFFELFTIGVDPDFGSFRKVDIDPAKTIDVTITPVNSKQGQNRQQGASHDVDFGVPIHVAARHCCRRDCCCLTHDVSPLMDLEELLQFDGDLGIPVFNVGADDVSPLQVRHLINDHFCQVVIDAKIGEDIDQVHDVG